MGDVVVAFVRHGAYEQPTDVPSAHLLHPLTQRGQEQARGGADMIMQWAADHAALLAPTIYTSHLQRAWQTGTIMAQRVQQRHAAMGVRLLEPAAGAGADAVQVQEDPALAERCVGPMANLTVAQIEQILSRDPRHAVPKQGWKSDRDYRLPFAGAESLHQAGDRVATFVRDWLTTTAAELESHAAGRTWVQVMVGHGAAFRHAAVTLGVLQATDVAGLSMYHARPVFLSSRGLEPSAAWHHIGGAWKERRQADAPD